VIHELNPELSNAFRNKVHDNDDFIRIFFSDFYGKDIWSKICSCMDWLDVSVQGIKLPVPHKSMNITSLEFTHFIVTIDMIFESIKHLWSSLSLATGIDYPFGGDRNVFVAYEFDKEWTDDAYFKNIRAWFGVHAVNGNKVQLKGFPNDTRFFTSWSSSFDGNVFSISVYSNNSAAEKQYGGIKKIFLNQIIDFISLRYNSLNDLITNIDDLYYKEKQKLKLKPVFLDKESTPLNQINQLLEQSNERKLTMEHYSIEIEKYISFLNCERDKFSDYDKELVQTYMNELENVIPAYYEIIQNVDWREHQIFELLNLTSQVYLENLYDFGKVLEYAENEDNPDVGSYSSYQLSMEILVENNLLPEYSFKLSGGALSLLIYAKDFKWRGESRQNNRSSEYRKILDYINTFHDK
jgi:hypothetical protein